MDEETREEIEEKQEEISNKEARIDEVENHFCYNEYDEMIDETSPEVKIGSLTYSPSQVLKNTDEVAYGCGYNDYFDEELNTLNEEIEGLKDEIDNLKEDLK